MGLRRGSSLKVNTAAAIRDPLREYISLRFEPNPFLFAVTGDTPSRVEEAASLIRGIREAAEAKRPFLLEMRNMERGTSIERLCTLENIVCEDEIYVSVNLKLYPEITGRKHSDSAQSPQERS